MRTFSILPTKWNKRWINISVELQHCPSSWFFVPCCATLIPLSSTLHFCLCTFIDSTMPNTWFYNASSWVAPFPLQLLLLPLWPIFPPILSPHLQFTPYSTLLNPTYEFTSLIQPPVHQHCLSIQHLLIIYNSNWQILNFNLEVEHLNFKPHHPNLQVWCVGVFRVEQVVWCSHCLVCCNVVLEMKK